MDFDDIRRKFLVAADDLEPEARQTVFLAYELAAKEHQGQLRKPHKSPAQKRDPYLIHPLRVFLVLREELSLLDVTALSSALLHDVLEEGNSHPSAGDIAALFGADIAETVSWLTKPETGNNKTGTPDPDHYHESFFRAPLLVRLVKLADRLDNMREALLVDLRDFQTRYLHETRHIYLPLAAKTSMFYFAGLKSTCAELEALLSRAAF